MTPPALLPARSTIAVATPASKPRETDALETGIARLRSLGFTVKTGRSRFPTGGYLSGTDEERAAELNAFISDPEVDAIFCTRGGYGSLRILPMLDYEAARRQPKLLVGYSDITALHLALFRRSGWKGISGPMVAVDWPTIDAACEAQFLQLATGARAPSGKSIFCEMDAGMRAMKAGRAAGTLLGGNLTVLTRLIGTTYLPSFKNAILFIEDVNEPAYRIDGMLAQIQMSGIWDQLAGLIVGQFTTEDSPDQTPPEIDEVFQDYCGNVSFPVASGLRYGHIPVKIAMPVGVRASLEVTADSVELDLEEP